MPPSFSTTAVIKRLSAEPRKLFHGAAPHILTLVAKKGSLVSYAENDVVFRVGDDAGWFYVVVDGVIVTQMHGVDVRPLHVGDVGGLTSSLPLPGTDPKKLGTRSMTHVARSSSATVLKLPHGLYRELLEDKGFALHAMAYMHMRIRSKTTLIGLLTGGSNEAASTKLPHPADMRIAVFDTKPYDRQFLSASFAPHAKSTPRIALKFIEAKLGEETAGLAAGCQAVCIFVNDVCNARVLLALKSAGVNLVLLRCAGFNNVNTKVAKNIGMTVLRVPAYSPNAVAEHAFALLQTVNRKTNRAYNRVRDGNFALAGLEGRDLKGLTAGVAGCGKIGRCFISIAKGCGMRVVIWDKFMKPAQADALGATLIKDFGEFMSQCDVLSLHLPLTPETKHVVNEQAIRRMPKGAIILNTGRGPLIETKALARALIDGHLSGAGLDVYEDEASYFFEDRSNEPIADDVLARLVNLPNVVITSHQAFLTDKALEAIASTTEQNAVAFQKQILGGAKEPLPNVVVGAPGSQSKL